MEKKAGSGLLAATVLHVERARGESGEEVWRIKGSGSSFYRAERGRGGGMVRRW
jgi:hypothetical protein